MSSDRRLRVSVIIPVHNTARFLTQCLGSVFAQTLSQDAIEIIAVDDGSSDDSLQMLHQLAEGHGNMQVIHQAASGSAAKPRNVGIEVARGDYLFFLDSDDYLHIEALEALVELADETGSGVVLPRMSSFGSAQPRASGTVKRTRRAVPYVSSRAYRTAHPGKLFRTAIVRDADLRFPTGYRIGEDMAFTYAVGLRSPHVSMLGDKPYYFVRWRDDQSSLRQVGQTADEVLLKNETVIRTIVRECSDPDDRVVMMQRSVLGRGGLWRVFTHPRVDFWDKKQRRTAFDRAHSVLAEAWLPEYRRRGSVEAHVMTTLIWAGDYRGAVHLARQMKAGKGLRLRRTLRSRERNLYVSRSGTFVRDVVDEDTVKTRLQEERQRRLQEERERKARP